MPRLQQGFTLVELMIVVAVIGILASIALPAFQDYTVRAKISEVILAMSACRSSISEIYQTGGSAPAANSWGCEGGVASQYVQKIGTDSNGVVTGTIAGISAAVNGQAVTFIPLAASATPATVPANLGASLYGWTCGGAGTTVNLKYLPTSCRG
ncbi:MAG TPA: pilin [Burkholderiales bacterium]|jgi:type IV pilus assembly protein PilA|nr:pilin [Burkholderiales bacterium]